MIDIHTHLLPYIDDGAQDRSEATEMMKNLQQQNVTLAVCTPHFDPSRTTLQDFIDKRTNSINSLEDSIIRLIPASETMLHNYLFYYPDLSLLCIENTRYLLLELPYDNKWDKNVYEKINRLIAHYDIIPIIAHIERYPAVNKKKKCIKKLISMGCLIQLNTTAILNKKTRARSFWYIKKGYIDVLGSDCHNLQLRPPIVAEPVLQIKEKFGAACCEKLDQNATSIIQGIHIRKIEDYLVENPSK